MIRHLRNSEIDRCRWDSLARATGQPYGLSWWLDVVSPGWEALVEDDYCAAMPLPVKRKMGIRYVVQPKWTQQLGLFGAGDVNRMLASVPYLSYDFNLNHTNQYTGRRALWHRNYIIDNASQPDANTRRNIRRAETLDYRSLDAAGFLTLWQSQNQGLAPEYHSLLGRLIEAAAAHGMACISGAYVGDRPVSGLFAVVTDCRIITLAPVSDPEGLERRAMFGLMARTIADSGEHIVDCEGSMLPGVARFYRGFGAHEQNYQRVWRLSPRRKS